MMAERTWKARRVAAVLVALVAGASWGISRHALALSPGVDPDADGWVSAIESQLGSNPADPASTPENVAAPPTCLDDADNDGDGQKDLADTGCSAPAPSDTTFPAAGLDVFDSRITLDAYQFDFGALGVCPVDFEARGPTAVQRSNPATVGTGLREIDVEIVALQLNGMATIGTAPGCLAPAGTYPVTMYEDPSQSSQGKVTDTNADASTDFPAQSFFDVFFQVETTDPPLGPFAGGPPGGPAGSPVRVTNTVGAIPPYQDNRSPNCYQVTGLAHEHCPKAPPDHFKCYAGKFPRFAKRTVTLEDQFTTATSKKNHKVLRPLFFCTPASKDAEPLYDEDAHLECYAIKGEKTERTVIVNNQYGLETVKTKKPALLCLPSQKNAQEAPIGADHFKCYRGKFPKFAQRPVTLVDQFGNEETSVLKPLFLCNPTSKNGEPIQDRLNHLKCYKIKSKRTAQTVTVTNQFGSKQVRLKASKLLCVPSMKFDGGTTTTTTVVPGSTTTTTTQTGGGRAVVLGNQTGNLPPGTSLCLSRVLGGCVAQSDVCPGVHLHGAIGVEGETGTFPDPNPGACGHGQITTAAQCGPETVPACGG